MSHAHGWHGRSRPSNFRLQQIPWMGLDCMFPPSLVSALVLATFFMRLLHPSSMHVVPFVFLALVGWCFLICSIGNSPWCPMWLHGMDALETNALRAVLKRTTCHPHGWGNILCKCIGRVRRRAWPIPLHGSPPFHSSSIHVSLLLVGSSYVVVSFVFVSFWFWFLFRLLLLLGGEARARVRRIARLLLHV